MQRAAIIFGLCGLMLGPARCVAAQQAPPPSEDDVYWDDRFYPPGPPSISGMTAGPDGTIYVIGGFNQIGGVLARRFAAWNGSEWLAAPGRFDGVSGRVLESDSQGYLYAAGADGVTTWDGSTWTMHGGLGATPNTIVVAQDGVIYAGGGGLACGGVFPYSCAPYGSGVKQLASSQWLSVGSDLLVVEQLAFGPSGVLYAVAADQGSSGTPCVWRYENGSAWGRLGNLELSIGDVSGLVVDDRGGVFVSGRLLSETDHPWGVARWDGSDWTIVKSGVFTDYLGFDPQNRVYALFRYGGGRLQIERWTDEVWEVVDDRLVGSGSALAFGQDAVVFAAGSFSGPDGIQNIGRLEDGDWHSFVPVGLGVDGEVREITPLSDGSLLVSGDFGRAGPLEVSGVVVWDTIGWRQWAPEPPGRVNARAIGTGGEVYIGGAVDLGDIDYFISRYEEEQWVGLTSNMTPKGWGSQLASVVELAVAPDGSLCAAGDFSSVEGTEANQIACWDGSEWHPLGSGLHASSIYAASIWDMVFDEHGSLFVTGDFVRAGEVSVNGIARWDGESWHSLGSGVRDTASDQPVVSSMAFVGDRLYVGGRFTIAGGIAASNVAAWDGERWYPLADGVNEPAWVLAAGPEDDLYVGGQFLWASEVRANRIARWVDDHWEALGTGLLAAEETVYTSPGSMNVEAMAFDREGALLVGGFQIARAGGGAGSNVARWLKPTGIVIEQLPGANQSLSVGAVYPNPSRSTVQLTIGVVKEQRVRLSVFDLLGREIAVLHDGPLSARGHEFVVNMTRWPAGLYIVSAAGNSGRAEHSLIHVR